MMDHTGEIFGHDLPYWMLWKYIDALIETEEQDLIYKTALHFLNDSFYTTAPLLFTSNELALSCVFLACHYQKVPTPADSTYDFSKLAQRLNEYREKPSDGT